MNNRILGTLVLGCYLGLAIFAIGATLHYSHRIEGPRQELRR